MKKPSMREVWEAHNRQQWQLNKKQQFTGFFKQLGILLKDAAPKNFVHVGGPET